MYIDYFIYICKNNQNNMKQIITLVTPTLSIIAFLFCIIIGEYTISMILLIVLIFSLFNNFKNLIK